jgi:uncharacterized membrane protein YedE/YeeE
MLAAILGGALIGLGASLAWVGARRVAGVSGLMGALFSAPLRRNGFALAFLAGLLLSGFALRGAPALGDVPVSIPLLALGGLLVGFGTQLGSGCTSGHGLCGVSRFSRRSIVATTVFVATGMVTATLMAQGATP